MLQKRNRDKDIQIVGTSTFNIRTDGKTIDQKSDAKNNSVDESAEVMIKTNQKISIQGKRFHFELRAFNKQLV